MDLSLIYHYSIYNYFIKLASLVFILTQIWVYLTATQICFVRDQGLSLTRNQGLHLQVHHHFPCKYMCHLNMWSWNRFKGYQKGKGMKRGRESIIGNKVRNGLWVQAHVPLRRATGRWRSLRGVWGAVFGDGELIVEEGGNVSVSEAEETGWTKETRGEGEREREREREREEVEEREEKEGDQECPRGERNQAKETCNSMSWRKREREEEGRVLMEDDIYKSHIMTDVRKVHLVALEWPTNTPLKSPGESLDTQEEWSSTKVIHPKTQGERLKRGEEGRRWLRGIAPPRGAYSRDMW